MVTKCEGGIASPEDKGRQRRKTCLFDLGQTKKMLEQIVVAVGFKQTGWHLRKTE
jgi:hypothetical protein